MRKSKELLSWQNGLLLLLIGSLLALSFFPKLRIILLNLVKKVKPGTSKFDGYPASGLIQKYAKDMGASSNLAKMLAAKAFFETGWFGSAVYLEGHNAFGMRCPRIRKNEMERCSYKNSKGGFAVFKSLRDSVNDYFLWWQYHKVGVKAMNFWSLRQLLQEEKDHSYHSENMDSYYKKVNWFYEKL